MKKLLAAFSLLAFLYSCSSDPKKTDIPTTPLPKEETVPTINYEIVTKLPHDTTSFTEGFLFHDGELFESTGSPENLPELKSVFGIVDLKTGKINKKAELDKTTYFGEGIVIVKNKIYQLTYKNQLGFIYDAKTFKLIDRFNYKNKEGWGMTTDGTSIIMSDGTNVLTYWDPATLKETKTLNVTNAGYAEDYLNELEYINGFIYANIWTKDYVVKINPETGKVIGIIDLSFITNDAKNKKRNADVLNGIAYDSITDKIYVTGKLFRDIYQITFPH